MTAITHTAAPVDMGRYRRRVDPHTEAERDLKLTRLELADLEDRKTDLVVEIEQLEQTRAALTAETRSIGLKLAALREQARLEEPPRTMATVIEEADRVRRRALVENPEHNWLGPRRLAIAVDEIAEHNKRCEKCIAETERRNRKGANTK